jgi:hypothetical protein
LLSHRPHTINTPSKKQKRKTDEELDVSALVALRGRPVRRVHDDVTLDKVLTRFLSASEHMLIAHMRPASAASGGVPGGAAPYSTPVTGLITLEVRCVCVRVSFVCLDFFGWW